MYCKHCGKEIADDAKFCPGCGKQTENQPPQQGKTKNCPKCGHVVSIYAQECINCGTNLQRTAPSFGTRNCPKCKSNNITYQTVTESRKAGCFTILFYVLLALTVFGLFIVIPLMLRKKTVTATYAVCQDCGNRWRIS